MSSPGAVGPSGDLGFHPSGAGPGTIAGAVWEGRRYAEELEAPTDDSDVTPYRREIAAIAP